MSAVDPAVAMNAKERELQDASARIVLLNARLAAAAARRKDVADLLGEGDDGLPLPMLPLTAALVGAIAANAAMFFGYVIVLTRFHETIWNVLLTLAMVLGLASLPLSSRPGAGGRARLGLRAFAAVGLALAMVEIVVAMWRAMPH